jgi:hypothetical protein
MGAIRVKGVKICNIQQNEGLMREYQTEVGIHGVAINTSLIMR